jgi:uncharacterized repeat protein (TIGR04076 family)
MAKCKITILKKYFDKELSEEHLKDYQGPCPVFETGQEFITDVTCEEHPRGFCTWAWDDIYKSLFNICNGGKNKAFKNEKAVVATCTDGLRPVVFKIERIEN